MKSRKNYRVTDFFRTGVYAIFNTTNGKFYIGSAAVSFGVRLKNHVTGLNARTHCGTHLILGPNMVPPSSSSK